MRQTGPSGLFSRAGGGSPPEAPSWESGESPRFFSHAGSTKRAMLGPKIQAIPATATNSSGSTPKVKNMTMATATKGPTSRGPTCEARAIQLRLAPARNGQRAALHFRGRVSTRGCSSVGRASVWHTEGRGFESPQLHSRADASAPVHEEVGAHLFRNHFGLLHGASRGGNRDPDPPSRQALRPPRPRNAQIGTLACR
jgi:hypothetical protein